MNLGELVKLSNDFTFDWAKKFGTQSFAMALSDDESFLIIDGTFGFNMHLGKINSTDGTLMATLSSE